MWKETITVILVLCSVKSSHGTISASVRADFTQADVTVFLIHTGKGFDFAPASRLSKGSKEGAFINQLFALAMKP